MVLLPPPPLPSPLSKAILASNPEMMNPRRKERVGREGDGWTVNKTRYGQNVMNANGMIKSGNFYKDVKHWTPMSQIQPRDLKKKRKKKDHLSLLYPEKSDYLSKWISIGAFHQATATTLGTGYDLPDSYLPPSQNVLICTLAHFPHTCYMWTFQFQELIGSWIKSHGQVRLSWLLKSR